MDQVLVVLFVDAGPHLVKLRGITLEYLRAHEADMIAQRLEHVVFVQAHIALPTAVIGFLDVIGNSGQPVDFLFHFFEMLHKSGLHHGSGPQ
jgi:hypothetical protein